MVRAPHSHAVFYSKTSKTKHRKMNVYFPHKYIAMVI